MDAQRRNLPRLRRPGKPRQRRERSAQHDAQTAAHPATKSCPDQHGGGSGNPARPGGLLENLAGTEDLAALMEARYTPTTHPGWPVRRAGGDPDGGALRVIGAAGWNHLLRAGFAALLPLECPGVAPPGRLMCAKERLGRLTVDNCQPTPFYCHPERLSARRRASTAADPAGCADQAGCTRRVTAVSPRSGARLDLAL